MKIPGPPDGAPSVHWPEWREAHIDELRKDPLSEYFVWWWEDIDEAEAQRYHDVLEAAPNERPLQVYLEEHPRLLVQHLWGNHARWAIPQKRLGGEYVPDFVIGEKHSVARAWTLVELQSPRTKLFTKKGRPTAQLDEGISQIQGWRRWLGRNRDYAQRPPAEGGLGLTGISDRSPGLILIGRAANRTAEERELIQQLNWDLHMQIRSYDWLQRVAENRIMIRREIRELQPGSGYYRAIDDDSLE